MIHVLEGRDVDVLEPFPIKELSAAVGWSHCYRLSVSSDDGPQTDDEIAEALYTSIQANRSWAIVDKANLSNTKKELPLVGLIVFEQTSPYNGYIHVTTARKAHRLGDPTISEQAVQLVINEIWTSTPSLTRISGATLATNKGAKSLMARLGFTKEGLLPALLKVKGEMIGVVHYGLLRPVGAVEVSNVVSA